MRRFCRAKAGNAVTDEGHHGGEPAGGNNETRTLGDAKIGDTVTVVKVHGTGAVRRRIMDMGITKGVKIYIRKVAPLGDPLELTVRGYELSIRRDDAEIIEIA